MFNVGLEVVMYFKAPFAFVLLQLFTVLLFAVSTVSCCHVTVIFVIAFVNSY